MQAAIVTGSRPLRAPGVASPHAARRLSRHSVVARAAEPQAKKVEEQPIDGLSSDYCDEFMCTSSPSVESSVRTLARDLERATARWTPIYAKNVEYSDSFRRFKGTDGYSRLDFVATSIDKPQVTITGMRMLSNASAEIRWRLTGQLGPLPVDVAGTSEVTMNLLTGRIERHIERWDLSACSPPAAAMWTARRALWSVKQASTDAGQGVDRVLDSLTSMDDDGPVQQENPNDPTKFFQQKDNSKQDMLQYVAVLALFYALVQAWLTLFAPTSSGGGGAFF